MNTVKESLKELQTVIDEISKSNESLKANNIETLLINLRFAELLKDRGLIKCDRVENEGGASILFLGFFTKVDAPYVHGAKVYADPVMKDEDILFKRYNSTNFENIKIKW